MLDGVWDTDPEWGAVIYVPSVDAVQEFKVQNNSFTAQYGWSTGNVVNVVSKSGTNAFHGDVYEFYRNDALDANSWFNNHNDQAKLAFNRNNPDPNTGNGSAQLLLGVLDGGTTGTTYNPAVATHYFGGYVQDDWTPIPKLTLNLGTSL